jgi:hypothetical protein
LGHGGKIPKPKKCGQWGYQEGGDVYYDDSELLTLTKRLATWLANDTADTYKKFNGGSESDTILRAASFLHP